jgi:CRP/FNR family transcriptional regulator, dissimilatory nitrate respiration regulator
MSIDLLTFETLPRSLQQAIFTKKLEAKQQLFWQRDAATALFIVKAGRLRLIRSTIDSKLVALQSISSGDSLGETALFGATYSYTAIAEVASQVIVYPKQELTAALREYPDLAEEIIQGCFKKLSR